MLSVMPVPCQTPPGFAAVRFKEGSPVQKGPAGLIVALGGVITVMVIMLEVSGLFIAHSIDDVIIHDIRSPFDKEAELYTGPVAPATGDPLSSHW